MATPHRPLVDDLDALLAGARRVGRFLVLADGTWLPRLHGGDGDDPPAAEDGETPDRVDEILAALEADPAPTLDELASFEAELVTLFDEAAAQRTQAGLEEARRIGTAYDTVVEARTAAEAEAAAVDEEMAEIAARFNRGEPAAEGDAPAADADDGDEEEAAAEGEPAVVAGGPPARRATRPTGRAPAGGLTPLPGPARGGVAVAPRTQLSATVSLVGQPRPPQTNAEILAAVWEVHRNLGHATAGAQQKVTVARANWQHPADQRLPKADANTATEVMDRFLSFHSLAHPGVVAAGGICGPLAVDYTMPVLGSDDRPYRDSLASFQVDRGGLTFVPSPILATGVPADFSGVWTVTDDEDETPTAKVCAEIICADSTDIEIEALYRCVEMTNFVNRYARERADAIMSLIRTAYARWAETRFLAVVDTGSTAITWTPVYGAVRDYLAGLGRITASYRRRHRVPRSVNLVAAFPDWLYDLMREDLANSMPSGNVLDNMAIADAQLDALFRSRGVRPVPFMDGANAEQIMAGAQGAGAVNAWPFRVTTYIYAEGTWVYADGGQLDLGVVRDSTLNSTNRLQMFQEEFGVVFKRGNESLKWNATVCPNGSSAGTDEPFTCDLS